MTSDEDKPSHELETASDTEELQPISQPEPGAGQYGAHNPPQADPIHPDTLLRLLAIVEEMHRTTSSRMAGKDLSAGIIDRIERLERWVATNRNP